MACTSCGREASAIAVSRWGARAAARGSRGAARGLNNRGCARKQKKRHLTGSGGGTDLLPHTALRLPLGSGERAPGR